MAQLKHRFTWKKKLTCALLLFGFVVSIVMGTIFNVILDYVIGMEVKKELTLKNGTEAYKFWTRPPVSVDFAIYVFDVVNHDEVKQGREKPFVAQRGPYVYKMHLHKQNIVRHDFNNTISYRQIQRFVFDREASIGSENDTFVTINIPLWTVASYLQDAPAWAQRILNRFMDTIMKETTFKKVSVYQIFWGYEDPMLELAYKALKLVGIHIPFVTGSFGFYQGKNNTDDGLYNVFSANDGNFKEFLRLDRWNGKRALDTWATPVANAIRGSSPDPLFPPYVTSSSNLSVFDSNLLRTLQLEYLEKSSYKGVDTLRLIMPFSDFANSTENPHNSGFCTPNTNYCIPSGAINFSAAAFGSPSYVSFPHFCGGDPYYTNLVKGLNPDPKKHQPYYDIHAITGVSLSAARRYQINIRIESLKSFPDYEHIPLAYLPIIWLDGVASMDDKDTAMFRDQIQGLLQAMPYVRIAVFCLGALFLLAAVFLFLYWRRKSKNEDQQHLIDDDDSNPRQPDSGTKSVNA